GMAMCYLRRLVTDKQRRRRDDFPAGQCEVEDDMVAFKPPSPALVAGGAEDRKKIAPRIAESVEAAALHEVDQAFAGHHCHNFRVSLEAKRTCDESMRKLLLTCVHLEEGKPPRHPREVGPACSLLRVPERKRCLGALVITQ